jgi:hypothetical protein
VFIFPLKSFVKSHSASNISAGLWHSMFVVLRS